MYVKQVVLFVLFYLSYCHCIRIWRHKSSCDRPGTGFTCLPKIGDKRTIIFECPSKTRDYHIYVNEFSGPRTLENLIIKNCKTLTVLFRCTKYAWEKKNLKYLEISNIEKLKIQSVALYQSLLPPTVVFENIKLIENIPSHTFTQTNKKLNIIRCVLPYYNFHSINFRNVSINTVQAKAFYMPDSFGNVTFTNVIIRTLESSSIIVNHDHKSVFLFEDSTVGLVKPSAVRVVAQKNIFSNNGFGEILPVGIRATTDEFNFINNTVHKLLHRQGLTVTSQHVLVTTNHFKYLKTGAFFGLGGSEKQFGRYQFVGNVVDFVEEDSLLPKLYSYRNVSGQIAFKKNTFSCECYQSGLLLSRIGKGNTHTTTDEFYKIVFDERSENVCSSTCNLPLSAAKDKIVQGKCTNRITVAGLCTSRKKTELKLVTSSPRSGTPLSPFTKPSYVIQSSNKPVPNKFKLEAKTTRFVLPTTRMVTTTTSSFISFHGTTNKQSINKQEIRRTTVTLPTTQKLTTHIVEPTKMLPVKYVTPNIYSSSSKNPFGASNDDLLLPSFKTKLETNKSTVKYEYAAPTTDFSSEENKDEKLKSKNTSPLPVKYEITTSSRYTIPNISASETSASPFSGKYTDGSTVAIPTKDELTSFSTDSSTEENTSHSSLETSSTLFDKTTNSDLSTEDEMTSTDRSTEEITFSSSSSSETSFSTFRQRNGSDIHLVTRNQQPKAKVISTLSTSVYNLTTATFSVTTVPTTKYKAAGSLTPTPKEISAFDEEFKVKTSNSNLKAIVGNCSKTYSLSFSLLLFLISFVLSLL
ncbi:uncharacterized protein LOC108907508 isoform X2 [Anoplophora glabripennis]|uniref:uncharacterized protein LOC108907508 isoform X2 n=1 Tax=Anoplophora glabripennis TaxID=217634 RepID=UPI0008756614|nr:uncharacterized protein LOC108907508 isoform X2 [Anoplophora glabripennis]